MAGAGLTNGTTAGERRSRQLAAQEGAPAARSRSPQELRAVASAFYGNDPAGTLLFWRGWSLHDRQTRLNDRLAMPPSPSWAAGSIVGYEPQTVEPIAEIDHAPGGYAGIEWRYGRRASVQLAYYDNRADPYAFSSGQWGWDTRFGISAYKSRCRASGDLSRSGCSGDTRWLIGARPDGTLASMAALVEDRLAASFAMLTRVVRGKHRVSIRYDDFEVLRREPPPALRSDAGHAWTAAYRYAPPGRIALGAEWLRIESRRDLWGDFYAVPYRAAESQLRFVIELKLHTGP